MYNICFFTEEITFQIPYADLLSIWIKDCIQASGKRLIQLNYIFCDDAYLLKLNKGYLHHDYFTDVLTFNYGDGVDEIEGDVYISIERVEEHVDVFGSTFYEELCRVLIHAVLHLVGYDDKTPEERGRMCVLEDAWLAKPILQGYLSRVYDGL